MRSLGKALVEGISSAGAGFMAGVIETIRPDGTWWRIRERPDGKVERLQASGTGGAPMTLGWGMACLVVGATLFLTGKIALFSHVPLAGLAAEALGVKGFLAEGVSAFIGGMLLRAYKNTLIGSVCGFLAAFGVGWARRAFKGLVHGGFFVEYLNALEQEREARESMPVEWVSADYRDLEYNVDVHRRSQEIVSAPPEAVVEEPSSDDLIAVDFRDLEYHPPERAATPPPAEPFRPANDSLSPPPPDNNRTYYPPEYAWAFRPQPESQEEPTEERPEEERSESEPAKKPPG